MPTCSPAAMASPAIDGADQAGTDLEQARLITLAANPQPVQEFYRAAGKALRAPLAERDAVIVYVRMERFGAFNRDPKALFGGRPLAAVTAAKRVVLVLDHSNEGLPLVERFVAAVKRLRDETPDRSFALIHVQNNHRVPDLVAAVRDYPWCAFGTFHHHLWNTLAAAKAENAVEDGLRLLGRTPRTAILCFNRAPRLHRMLTLMWLYRTFPQDDFLATFAGFENSKHDYEKKFRNAAADFPGTDPERIVAAVEALGVPGMVGEAGTALGSIVHRADVAAHAATFFSFVTESDMSAGEIERFTEKSIKPLAMGHPIVVAGNPWTVRLLERLGFDLLRDEIDHGYDAILQPEARLSAAFRSAEALARLTPDGRAAFLKRNRERLRHNVAQFDGRLLRRLEAVAADEALANVTRALKLWDGHPAA